MVVCPSAADSQRWGTHLKGPLVTGLGRVEGAFLITFIRRVSGEGVKCSDNHFEGHGQCEEDNSRKGELGVQSEADPIILPHLVTGAANATERQKRRRPALGNAKIDKIQFALPN